MVFYYLLRWSILTLTGLLIYAQTFHFGFVFDDHIFIVANPFIKNFNNIHLMWHTFPMTRLVGMYSFALNYHLNQLNAGGYHIFNFIVHLACAGLAWGLADLLFKATRWLPSKDRVTGELPFIIALMFLVHPCQTQAVTYITQRFESMATMFYLAAMYAYLRARLSSVRLHQFILFGLAGACTILGIMTKEVVITLPVMVLAWEWILFPKKENMKLAAFVIVGGILLCVLLSRMVHDGLSSLMHSYISESHDGDILTPGRYLLTEMRVFLTFLRLLVLPVHQNLDYDYPASRGLLEPPLTLAGLCMIMGIIFLVVKLYRRAPLPVLGLAWILITFSINLVPRNNAIFEHKLYLISFGFILSFVTTLSLLVRNRATLFKILCCMIGVLLIVSFERNKVWANELTLWQDCVKKSPLKARVNSNLGRVYGSLGIYDKAIYYLSRSIAIRPDNIAYEDRGVIYGRQGKYLKALQDLNQSIAMVPAYSIPYVKRSWIYQSENNMGAALTDLSHAIKLDPLFTDAYIERGMLWMALGRYQIALIDFQQVLDIDPLNDEASQYKTLCLMKLER